MQNDLHNTNSTIHSGYYAKQITRKFKPADLRRSLYILTQKAVILKTCRMVRKFLEKTVNKKCVLSETDTFFLEPAKLLLIKQSGQRQQQ